MDVSREASGITQAASGACDDTTTAAHAATFQRNTATGAWRARCTCGWGDYGTQEEVQATAAVHDLWEPAEPPQPAPQPAVPA